MNGQYFSYAGFSQYWQSIKYNVQLAAGSQSTPVELLILAKFYCNQSLDPWDIAALHEIGSFEPATVRAILAIIDPSALLDFNDMMNEIHHMKRKHRHRPPKRDR
jgi:hypothetical protein